MEIEKALKLVPNSYVHCPADRGDMPFTGRVVSVGEDVRKTQTGSEYVWVCVSNRDQSGRKSVWPSNRLG